MRDCCNNLIPLDSEDAVYKEVVIIGNGPSGIMLSYILSGNWPYYNGGSHPDDMLTARLRCMPLEKSLLEQDLEILSQGLEGRSRNPVAVLMDNLNHPYDDQNLDDSEACLVDWKHNPRNAIDHVVVGKGKAGGSWQTLSGDLTTISISSWMELPGLSFAEWETKYEKSGTKPFPQRRSTPGRVKIKQVAQYYDDYVNHVKLSKNLRNFAFVASVKKFNNSKLCPYELCNDDDIYWEVEGYDIVNNSRFKYVCRNVVLAIGTGDIHKTLNVPGELSNPDWVFYDFKSFETAIFDLVDNKRRSKGEPDPVLVIGSGLSAADAILTASRYNVPIIHIFNTYSLLDENKLPSSMYAEYHRVYKMMKNVADTSTSFYRPLQQYTVLELRRSTIRKRVRIMAPDGQRIWRPVSMVVVMLGYRPELNFLPSECNNGRTLGVHKHQTIDSGKNPISVAPWSYEVMNSSRGLYAMGPLVGDNVVRVIPGGALAIASDLYRKKQRK